MPQRRNVMRLLLILGFGLCVAPLAPAKLLDALTAQRVLTDLADCRMLRIDRSLPGQAEKPSLYAVAFVFEDLLWLYVGESGTRVLGPATKSWPSEDEFAARLQQIDPSVVGATLYAPPTPSHSAAETPPITNGCVVACITRLAQLLIEQNGVHDAGLVLLAYDSPAPTPEAGLFVNHAVLVFRDDAGWQGIDPGVPETPFRLENVRLGAPLDPALVQAALGERYPLKSARLLMLSPDTLARITHGALWRARPRLR